jgi:hypothetical protein
LVLVSLPGHFHVWLASPEAFFLKAKFVRVNWDVDELKEKAKEIGTSGLYGIGLGGWLFDWVIWKMQSKWKEYLQ